jgi:two-component sensor histidine kinase
MTGLEFLTRLHSADPAVEPECAVVMLTGTVSEQIAVDAMKAGAQDYLVKDCISADGLKRAVEKAVEKVGLIRALKSERDRLARSLAEKEILLKEVHHRVKNNLQVIVSLLRLQASQHSDEHIVSPLRESQHRIESMALIHEKLYETDDLREVNLAQHASLLASNLFQSYGAENGRITWRLSLDPLPLGVDQAIPAGLILNELISNALKHAFPNDRAGCISIGGGRRGELVILEVRDNGVGIPPGLASRKPKSLGLEIVNILTRQLKGTFDVESGEGAAFRVSFPARS